MKKFSTISNYTVPTEPKPQINKEEPQKNFKGKLIGLMDDLLKIQSTGAARTELINTAITISGKEMLADAIIDLLSNQVGSEKIHLLESLKLEMNDWYFLDNKIDQLNAQTLHEKNSKDSNIEKRLISFLELYGGDSNYELHTEMFCNRISKKSDLRDRILVAESLLNGNKISQNQKKQIKLLIEKFKQRVNK